VEGFRYVPSQPVEFRDLDGLGHANNAVYLSYLESAKVDCFRDVVGADRLEDLGIVADVQIAYRSPAFFGETLDVGVRVARVGTKSLRFELEIRGARGRLVAERSSTHVAFDYATREPAAVPDRWRRAIDAYEAQPVGA
jgi:acyl-CoA thioester hydrolase